MGGKGKPVGISDMLPQIIDEVSKLWPSCKIVHGRARHSPSQGGVERLNPVSYTHLTLPTTPYV